MSRSARVFKIIRRVIAAVILAEVLYLLAGNIIIRSGLIQHFANMQPDIAELNWDSAYTTWPGHVYVTNFRLRVQDPFLQFFLTVDEAEVDVALTALPKKTFHASRVRASGVTYRFVTRVDSTSGIQRRLEAFPEIEGLTRPPMRPKPLPPQLTEEQIKNLWTVKLEDVDATAKELWLMEYRYQGAARMTGGFELAPLQRLWVGPVVLLLEGGTLHAGKQMVAKDLTSRIEVTIDPVEDLLKAGMGIFRGLDATVQFDAKINTLDAAALYVNDLETRGSGRLVADVKVEDGKVLPGSTVKTWLNEKDARINGHLFTGTVQADFSVTKKTETPMVHASLKGQLMLPELGKPVPVIDLNEVDAEVALTSNSVAELPQLKFARATITEATIRDARPLVAKAGQMVPIFANFVLGSGPLVATATAYANSEYALIRLKHLKLGDAWVKGAAMPTADGWKGAATGHFGAIPVGIKLRGEKVDTVLFAPDWWYGRELDAVGIERDQQESLPPAFANQ